MSDTPEIYCTASVSVTYQIPLKSIAQLHSLSRVAYPCNLFLHSFGLCHAVGFTGCVQSYAWACSQTVVCAFSSSCCCCRANRFSRNGPCKLGITSWHQLLQISLLLWGLGVFVCVFVCVCVCVCACVCMCFVSVTQNAQIDMVSMEMSTFVLVSVMSSKLATGLIESECI